MTRSQGPLCLRFCRTPSEGRAALSAALDSLSLSKIDSLPLFSPPPSPTLVLLSLSSPSLSPSLPPPLPLSCFSPLSSPSIPRLSLFFCLSLFFSLSLSPLSSLSLSLSLSLSRRCCAGCRTTRLRWRSRRTAPSRRSSPLSYFYGSLSFHCPGDSFNEVASHKLLLQLFRACPPWPVRGRLLPSRRHSRSDSPQKTQSMRAVMYPIGLL